MAKTPVYRVHDYLFVFDIIELHKAVLLISYLYRFHAVKRRLRLMA